MIAALITSHGTPQGLPTDDAFTIGFWACTGVAVIAVVGALLAPSMRARRASAAARGIDDLDEVAS